MSNLCRILAQNLGENGLKRWIFKDRKLDFYICMRNPAKIVIKMSSNILGNTQIKEYACRSVIQHQIKDYAYRSVIQHYDQGF